MKFPCFVIVLLAFFSAGCFQPKEGCLDVRATNYDVSSDDPCPESCCTYPTLSVTILHRIVLPSQPDTSFTLRYDSLYPSPFDPSHYFSIKRSRYFLSNFRLVKDTGEEVSASDSLELETLSSVNFTVKNSFAKADRDIFQASNAGVFLASGVFSKIRFTLGLEDPLPETDPEGLIAGNPLSIAGDTFIYKENVGYIPNQLIFRRDTVSGTDSLNLRFFEPKAVEISLTKPVEVTQGFNLNLTLRINYMAWFEGVDMVNDSPAAIQAKIDGNLTKAISVTEFKIE